MPVLVLLHDEVREWHPRALRVVAVRELQRHPAALGIVVDADHVHQEMKRLFTGQIEIELGLGTFIERQIDAHEEPAFRDVLDESINDQARVRTTARSDLDGDPNRFPFVHVGKGRVTPHVGQSNCNYGSVGGVS